LLGSSGAPSGLIRAMRSQERHPRPKGTGKEEDMTRLETALAGLVVCATLVTPRIGFATEFPMDTVARDVEAASAGFRACSPAK